MAFRLIAFDKMLARDQRGNERGARGVVERARGRSDRREHVNRPRVIQPAKRQHRQDDRGYAHGGLRAQHHPSPIPCVGHRSARDRKNDDRDDSDQPHDAEGDRAPVSRHEQRDMPENRGRLHHRTGERNQLSDPEEAEVAVLQREKRRRSVGCHESADFMM